MLALARSGLPPEVGLPRNQWVAEDFTILSGFSDKLLVREPFRRGRQAHRIEHCCAWMETCATARRYWPAAPGLICKGLHGAQGGMRS